MIDRQARAREHATCSAFAPYRAETGSVDLDELRAGLARVREVEPAQNDQSYYRRLVETLRQERRLQVRRMRDLYRPLEPECCAVALRHDVDRDPFAAVELADVLAEAGLAGSFYLLHTVAYYGRLEGGTFVRHREVFELLRQVQDRHGSEVGLHTDPLMLYLQHRIDGAAAVRDELEWLRNCGFQVSGTAAHNSAPVYGAENFEIFEGRAVLGRFVLARNELRTPLQVLGERELELEYEANHPVVSQTELTLALSQFVSGAPPDGVRNRAFMQAYLVNNPYCLWGHDYNVWLLGYDQWVIAGHRDRDPLFLWDARLEDVQSFIRRLPAGRRAVLHVHPDYIEWAGRHRAPDAVLSYEVLRRDVQRVQEQVELGGEAARADLAEVLGVIRYLGPWRLRAIRDAATVIHYALAGPRAVVRAVLSLVHTLRGRAATAPASAALPDRPPTPVPVASELGLPPRRGTPQ
jgi:hypothetical protein